MTPEEFGSLIGMEIVVVDDNDERLKDTPKNCVATNGVKFLVRRSEWPDLRDKIVKLGELP